MMCDRAGTTVGFDIVAENTGNMILRGTSLSSNSTQNNVTVALPVTCTQPVDIPVGGQLACTITSMFNQDGVELGDRVFDAKGTSMTLVTDTQFDDFQAANPVTIDVVEMPVLEVDVMGAECTHPARMRK
jgi:hypothetical protein